MAVHPIPFGREQKFWYPHIRKTPRQLLRIFFWSGMGQNGPKRPISSLKWPKMPILVKIWPFVVQKSYSFGEQTKLWYPYIKEPMTHLFRVENIDQWGSNWLLRTKMWKFGYLGPKVNFLCWNCDFCRQGISPVFRELQLSFWDHLKNNSNSKIAKDSIFCLGNPIFVNGAFHHNISFRFQVTAIEARKSVFSENLPTLGLWLSLTALACSARDWIIYSITQFTDAWEVEDNYHSSRIALLRLEMVSTLKQRSSFDTLQGDTNVLAVERRGEWTLWFQDRFSTEQAIYDRSD